MAHIIRCGIYRIAVPAGFPPIGCEVRSGALVRAWVGEVSGPVLTWDQFRQMPVRPEGTPFQMRVWQALQAVPFGTVVSYAELARRVGAPKAARAVGQAVSANPILWRIPCHRVVRSDGQLGGFSAGTLIKCAFLAYEGITILFNDETISVSKTKACGF